MKQDRFLFAILAVVLLLVIAALVVFFLRQDALEYGPEDTPEGVVRNYLIAIHREDFERAYGYLQETPEKPDYQEFRQSFLGNRLRANNVSAKINETEISGDEAIVAITITHGGTDPFEGTWNNTASALLVLQANQWKLIKMPSPYWGWYP